MQRILSAAALSLLVVAGNAASGEPAAVIRSVGSGPWSADATWEGGKVPGSGARVLIRAGHTVIYDVRSEQVIRSINIAGVLRFDPDRDTRLDVGLIAVRPGEQFSEEGFDCARHVEPASGTTPQPALEVGTPAHRVDRRHTALIRLVYVPGLDKQSCPAIVACGGRMDFHGAQCGSTWTRLGQTAMAGAASVVMDHPASWSVGDRIIVTATGRDYRVKESFTEERIIKGFRDSAFGPATTLELDEPLKVEHRGDGDYRGEVANLSRNVIVESADPAGIRGHTMYHRGSAGSISYAEFRHLGKKGVLGRYALHYHLCGDTMRGSSVIGASIWDSDNRWLTIHGTNYLVVRDCVGYKSVGHGYFMEDGTEVFNVLDHNLAVGARRGKRLPEQVLPFDQNDGAGFWWANSLNTFTRNVAADNGQYGFRYEATPSSALKLVFRVQQPDGEFSKVDIRTLPFVRFEDNEVHSSTGLYGVNLGEGVNRVGPDTKHPFIVRNLKIWDIHYAFRPQVPSLLAENVTIHQAAYGVYHPNYENHVYRNMVISQTNTEPFNRGHDDLSVQYGVLAVDGLTFDGCRSGGMPLIQISDDNPTGSAVTHMRNVKTINWKDNSKARSLVNLGGGPRPTPKTAKGVPVFLHDWYGPGRHAMVASTRSAEYKTAPDTFRIDAPLTGDESRVCEVKGIAFPELLKPVDDLPPTTVITHLTRAVTGKLVVSGTTADNGTVKRVVVNGKEARATTPNFAEWEVTLDAPAGALRVQAQAEDAAGNVEPRPHVINLAN
jgi:hypothetical protein